ncbi:MAG: hypothetical protein ACHQNV_02995 [Vicinamibacteria bacterium]
MPLLHFAADAPAARTVQFGPRMRIHWTLALLFVLALALASCGEDCGAILCPVDIAVIIDVRAAGTGGSVPGAFVLASSSATGSELVPCILECVVFGPDGTYNLEVGAPGFQTARRSVMVRGTRHCECRIVATERLDVVLVLNP